MRINANAKINIGLNVLDTRKDGYHNIYSLFSSIELYDTLTIDKSDRLTLSVTDKNLPTDSSNLALKAVLALSEASGKNLTVRIHLEKRIPVGSGLGGGSSDCAAVLYGLNQIYNLNYSMDELKLIGKNLGADVPFQLQGGLRICSGIGDIFNDIDAEPLNDYVVCLCTPNIQISTRDAYENIAKCEKFEKNEYEIFLRKLKDKDFFGIPNMINNDFEKYVFVLYPQLNFIKNNLLEAGAVYAGMSGSGSSIFGIFHNGDFLRNDVIDHVGKCSFINFAKNSLIINR